MESAVSMAFSRAQLTMMDMILIPCFALWRKASVGNILADAFLAVGNQADLILEFRHEPENHGKHHGQGDGIIRPKDT